MFVCWMECVLLPWYLRNLDTDSWTDRWSLEEIAEKRKQII